MNLPNKVIEGLESALDHYDNEATGGDVYKVVNKSEKEEGASIRELRATLRLSQAQFAHNFGIPIRTLEKWEQGTRKPDHAVRSYLKVIAEMPDAVTAAIQDQRDKTVARPLMRWRGTSAGT
jgi:DNA-binding transcriptional regulator YiaG